MYLTKVYFPKVYFPKVIYLKCIFAKCTRLVCLLSFASLFLSKGKTTLFWPKLPSLIRAKCAHWGPPAEGRKDPSFYKLLCEEKRGKRVRGEYFDEQEGAEKNLLTRKLRLESAANTVF